MQLVHLPAWLYGLVGLVLVAVGVAIGRVPVEVAGAVTLLAGGVKLAFGRR
jgi:hypothetical protein